MIPQDLESLKTIITRIKKFGGKKVYNGIVPKSEADLPQVKSELTSYIQTVWDGRENAFLMAARNPALDAE